MTLICAENLTFDFFFHLRLDVGWLNCWFVANSKIIIIIKKKQPLYVPHSLWLRQQLSVIMTAINPQHLGYSEEEQQQSEDCFLSLSSVGGEKISVALPRCWSAAFEWAPSCLKRHFGSLIHSNPRHKCSHRLPADSTSHVPAAAKRGMSFLPWLTF